MIERREKGLLVVAYVLPLLGLGVIAFIIALIKKGDAGSRAADSHWVNIIALSLWYTLWLILCIPLMFILIGVPLLFLIEVLALIRVIFGLIDVSENRAYRRNPKAAFL